MILYSLAVISASDKPAVVRLVRHLSQLGVSEIARRIGSSEPVVEFDTRRFEPGATYEDGVLQRQAKLRELIAKLKAAGASISIVYHTSVGDESISEEMLENRFRSDVISLRQEHD